MPRRARNPGDPLVWTWAETAELAFRKSESWLRDHLDTIQGFPKPVDGVFHREAVQQWIDRRHRFIRREGHAKMAAAIEAAKGGARARSAPNH